MAERELVKVQQHILAQFAVMRDDAGWNRPCDEREEQRFQELLDDLNASNGVVEGRDTAETVSRVKQHLAGCKWTVCAIIEVKSKRGHHVVQQALSHPQDLSRSIPTALWKTPDKILEAYRHVLAAAADAKGREELLRRRKAKEM